MGEALTNYFLYNYSQKDFSLKVEKSLAKFIDITKQYVEELKKIGSFLQTEPLPLGPTFHPCVRKDAYEMICQLQMCSGIVSRLNDRPSEIKQIGKLVQSSYLDADKLWKYAETVDRWFRSYK